MKLPGRVSDLIEKIPSRETVTRVVENLTLPEKAKLPLVMCFYLTYGCNAACEFCSQKEQVYGAERGKFRDSESDTEKHLRILRIVREEVPNIYFLGGEPTASPHLREVLEESKKLKFENIAINTNGIVFRPEILEYADTLIISLHCDDSEKAQRIYRVSHERAKKIYENVWQYISKRNKRRTRVILNCVVTGDSIDDAYDAAELARKSGVQLNIAPAIGRDGKPDARLIHNPQYIEMLEWVAKQKGLSSSSANYLQTIKTFEPFTCNPHATPGVQPNGDLIVPCANLPEGHESVNLLEVGSVGAALRIGREKWEEKHGILDTQKRCREMCHKTCYVETAALGTVHGVRKAIMEQLNLRRQQRETSYFDPSPKEQRSGKSPNVQRNEEEIAAMPTHECDGPCPRSDPGAGMVR
jgi:MoaA/NifB/PqqE/SkfB family radical SAM enzyme